MLIFAAALVLILVWLLPREQTFRNMLASQQADRVSIAYARLLLSISPDDEELSELLAAQYYQLGELDNAWSVLESYGGGNTVLGISVLESLTYAQPPGERRQRWQVKLYKALQQAATNDAIKSAELRSLAIKAKALDKPRLAAGLLERAFHDSNSVADLTSAAQAWIAADAPEHAVRILLSSSLPLDEELTKVTLAASLATGDAEESLRVIDAYLKHKSPEDAPSVDLNAHIVRALLSANRASRIPDFLALLPPPGELSVAQSTEFAKAAIASGELSLAKKLMERALEIRSDDAQILSQLAQVYEWTGQPEDALSMWLRASGETGNRRETEKAWRLSRGLYHYQNVANLLSRLSERQRLTDEEVAVLRLAWEQHGDPVSGEEVLNAYLKRWPDHRQAWSELIGLQTNNLRLENAADSWAAFNLHHTLSLAENQAWADIPWRLYRPRKALNILLSREPTTPNSAYWRQLAAYAWFLDEPGIASRAMEARLAEGERLNNAEMGQLIQGSGWSNPSMVAVHAATAWEQQPDNIEFLLTALYAAIEADDIATADELFEKALASEAARGRIDASAAFWTLNANHLQKQGDLAAAQNALSKALALQPRNPDLQASQMWMHIARNEQTKLKAQVDALQADAAEQPVLWAPLASAYALLHEHHIATRWFNKAIQANTTDIGLLLAYSGSLDALGWRDPAYRLRRHTLRLLAAQAAKRREQADGVNPDTLIAASRDLISGPQQRALLSALLQRAPSSIAANLPPGSDADVAGAETEAQMAERLAAKARFEFADALRREHYSSARYWLSAGAQASPGDRLVLAAEEYDESTLAGFAVSEDYTLSSQAALALRQPGLAMDQTLLELERNPQNREAIALRDSISRELRPSGWQVTPVVEKLGGVRFNTLTARYSRRFERFHLDTRLRRQNARTPLLTGHQEFAETSIDNQLSYTNRFGGGSVNLQLTQGDERSLVGINWTQEFLLDRRNSLVVALEHNARMQGGGVAQALLSRSGARLDWNAALSARLQLTTTLSQSTYRDQAQRRIGDVTQFTLSPNYVLSRSGPTVNLRGQAQWTQSTEASIGDELLRFLRFPDQEVLPADGNSLSVGAVVRRDAPGQLDWRRSGTHYLLSADVGYRWPQKNLTFNSEAAVGVPIFGRDRLTMSAVFTNSLDNEVSETGVRAQLTYSRRIN